MTHHCTRRGTASGSRASGSTINPGVIVGIVAVLLIALLAPLLVFVVWKRREAKRRQFRMMPPEDMLASDLPSAALRLTPFHPSHYDMESGEWSYPPSRSSRAGSSSMCLFPPCHFDSSDAELVALPPAAVRTSHEKKASLPDLPGGEVAFHGEHFRRQSILGRCLNHAIIRHSEFARSNEWHSWASYSPDTHGEPGRLCHPTSGTTYGPISAAPSRAQP